MNSITNKVHYIFFVDKDENKDMQKRYETFMEDYAIKTDKETTLVVAWDDDCITITPEIGNIKAIYAIQPTKKLETKLKQINVESSNFIFETKDKKRIIVRKSY
jgi:hypothetical protein